MSTWRQRIDPILKAEEDRGAFDIHEYGTHIIGRLVDVTEVNDQDTTQAPEETAAAAAAGGVSSSSDPADFAQVAGATDAFEVCRVFAAMLQLVNNR